MNLGLILRIFLSTLPSPSEGQQHLKTPWVPQEDPHCPGAVGSTPGPLTMRIATKQASVVFQSPLPVAAAGL